jgi:hypothetical protein
MGYRVRTPDGELGFPTLLDVEQAYTQGLVGPEDEVLEDGHSKWRKASSIPALARVRPVTRSPARRNQVLTIAAAVALGFWALMLLVSDTWPAIPSGLWERRALGIVLALVMSTLLTRVTAKAFKRPGLAKD